MQIPIKATKHEIGFIVTAQDYLLYLEGLPSVKVNDILISENGSRALVAALDRERIEALMLDRDRPRPGDSFTLSTDGIRLPLKSDLFGRTINPLGFPLDGKPALTGGNVLIDLDAIAPGIDARKIITEQLISGITMIDTLLPIGKGQRELIIGEPRSGKAQVLVDFIANQRDTGTVCVYAAIGKSEIDLKRFAEDLERAKANTYTIVVAATSNESAPLISIAPYVACSIAEYYCRKGTNVLLILDDLSTHAKYLREIALLSGRIPGRESYPADIFYQHSHLVERAGNFNYKAGNASITLLPVVEANLENLTTYIPTNVMSMTDGHIFFSAGLRAEGFYPSIEADRSVTRVGHQTQKSILKILADRVRLLLADYHELERYGHFGSELTAETQVTINKGMITVELMKQETGQSIAPPVQIMLLSLIFTPFFDKRDVEFIRRYKEILLKTIMEAKPFQELGKILMEMELEAIITKLTENLKLLEDACRS